MSEYDIEQVVLFRSEKGPFLCLGDPKALETLYRPDDIVLRLPELEIVFDFPLRHETTFTAKAKNPKGFTRAELGTFINENYSKIYEDQQRYGVWGHDLAKLKLREFHLTDKGQGRLDVSA